MRLGKEVRDIVLITVDCLRADHVYGMEALGIHAPNISKLAKGSLCFTKAITNGPGTRFAFPAMMMSKLPGELKGTGLPKEGGVTLAEFMKGSGYTTVGINSNGWLSRDFNYHRGFDYFFDPRNWGKKEHGIKEKFKKKLKRDGFLFRLAKAGRNLLSLVDLNMTFSYQLADAMNRKLFETIRENGLEGKKKFVWLHYMDAHHPFYFHRDEAGHYPSLKGMNQNKALDIWRKAGEDISTLSTRERTSLRDLYKSEITYLDRYIGEVVAAFPGALIIFTADHGEEFGEHGRFHAPTCFSEMLDVPLLINHPEFEHVESGAMISHVDMAPHISALLGLEWTQGETGWSGGAHPGSIEYQYAMYEDGPRKGMCILDGRYKLVVEEGESSLRSRDDAAVDSPEDRDRLAAAAVEFERRINGMAVEMSEPEVSDEIAAQLKSLGYL